MAKQMELFGFEPVARDILEAKLNLLWIIKNKCLRDFILEADSESHAGQMLLTLFFRLPKTCLVEMDNCDAFVLGRMLTRMPGLTKLDENKCSSCDKPAIYYNKCNCREMSWCKDHEDSIRLWQHVDHYCSPECCARFHAAKVMSMHQIRSQINPLIVTIEQLDDTQMLFGISTRRRSARERHEAIHATLRMVNLKELSGQLPDCELDYRSIRSGIRCQVQPNIMSDPCVALAAIRAKSSLIVTALGPPLLGGRGWICELPAGFSIPFHSERRDGREVQLFREHELRPL